MNGAVTVSQLNKYVNSVLESDPNLSGLFVKGEISSFKRYPSGHLYFNLRDDKSTVSCVMFKVSTINLMFQPKDGDSVIVFAKASLYDRDGKFQLYINTMKQEGVGDLYVAFEQLKSKLSQEGLFDQKFKKTIPFLPNRIGVVTSPSGAVIRDIINVLSRRFPDFNLLLVPSNVQGNLAAQSIVLAIEELNKRDDIDVVIIARGGGSIEDLWCFNEEIVARAVFNSEIPIISAIGHETDYTICDFVADMRAPTPSAAAELVMPVKNDCESAIILQEKLLRKKLMGKLDFEKLKLKHIEQHRYFTHPELLYEKKREYSDKLEQKISVAFKNILEKEKNALKHFVVHLDGLSPLKVLLRGYGVVQNKQTEKSINSIESVKIGDNLSVRLSDGILDCLVKNIKNIESDT